MRRLAFILIASIFSIQLMSQENRVALVIGNSDYQQGYPLPNPENDANDIAILLNSSGFKVAKYTNVDQVTMKRVIDEFGNNLHSGGVALFFYAGHGIQANGRNYLIPVDASLKTENDIEYNCVDAGRVLAKMEDAGTNTNIVILDACRDNPFERGWSRSSKGQGLAFMDAPRGSLIAYSTAPGKTASDGYGRNSPYTSALKQYMTIPNFRIEDCFKLVRSRVREITKGQQIPWESTSLEGEFYFSRDPEDNTQLTLAEKIEASAPDSDSYSENIGSDDQWIKEFEENKKLLARNIRSIAILPFSNYTGNEEQAFLLSGMHDALISELGQLGTIRVVSRTSTLSYTDFRKTIKEIAAELHVDAIVEASVLKIEKDIRIQLKLFSAYPEEQLLWSKSFDSDITHILYLYNQIIKNIANQIQLSFTPNQQNRLEQARQVNPEAYETYLRGKVLMGFLTADGILAARDYFQKALTLDPEYAPAYAGLAGAWIFLKTMRFVPMDEANPKLEEYLSKAIQLDSQNVEVYYFDALKKMSYDFDWEGSERSFRHCLELNPNFSEAWAFYSHLVMCLKRADDMREAMNRALELDPNSFLIKALAASELRVEGKYAECIDKMKTLQAIAPNSPIVTRTLFSCYAETGNFDLAIDELKKMLLPVATESVIGILDNEYKKSGFKDALNALANQLTKSTTSISASQILNLYSYAGNIDRTLDWIEELYKRRDPNCLYLGVRNNRQLFENEPRYLEILHQLNLPSGELK